MTVFGCKDDCGIFCVWNSEGHHSFMFKSCGSVLIKRGHCVAFLGSQSEDLEVCMLSFES